MAEFKRFVWKNGVVGFGLPLAVVIWVSIVVTELGWSGLWSFPALLGLGTGLIAGGLMGGLFGIALWSRLSR